MSARAARSLALFALVGCNTDPSDQMREQVGYRTPGSDVQSGERGNIAISEIGWAGSVNGSGQWDSHDVFIEFRNEGSFPTNLSFWQIQVTGVYVKTFIIPETPPLEVGEHKFFAAKTTGCFPEPDGVIPELYFGSGDPFEATLKDADERLIEGAGDDLAPPFAGGFDGVRARSMERVELMFGGEGTEGQVWHFYTPQPTDVPNYDEILDDCRGSTLASPGRPNSPDYSGAFATGNFD